MQIIHNGHTILVNNNYYKNILVKLKTKCCYYSIGCIISCGYSKPIPYKEYTIITRFSKIFSFRHNIPLDIIYLNLIHKFPLDIVSIIVEFYLSSDVSFKSIRVDNDFNTIKVVSTIKYSTELQSYQRIVESSHTHKDIIKRIESFISNNFLHLLNNCNYFDTNDIVKTKIDSEIEFCKNYKIYNSDIAWGFTIE